MHTPEFVKDKFVIYTADETTKKFVPVDCIGIVITVKGMNRVNGKDVFGIGIANKYGPGETILEFPTETQRDEKLAEILEKVSQR